MKRQADTMLTHLTCIQEIHKCESWLVTSYCTWSSYGSPYPFCSSIRTSKQSSIKTLRQNIQIQYC
jgi:hypothetical protein